MALSPKVAKSPLNSAHARGNQLNGSLSRSFYVFGRNPNTIADVKAALGAGANALEPDVQVGASHNLVVAHEPNQFGKISLVDYLSQLHDLAFDNNLALVTFDVKSEAASADHGLEILKAEGKGQVDIRRVTHQRGASEHRSGRTA